METIFDAGEAFDEAALGRYGEGEDLDTDFGRETGEVGEGFEGGRDNGRFWVS